MEIIFSQDKCLLTASSRYNICLDGNNLLEISTENEKIAELIFSFDPNKKKTRLKEHQTLKVFRTFEKRQKAI